MVPSCLKKRKLRGPLQPSSCISLHSALLLSLPVHFEFALSLSSIATATSGDGGGSWHLARLPPPRRYGAPAAPHPRRAAAASSGAPSLAAVLHPARMGSGELGAAVVPARSWAVAAASASWCPFPSRMVPGVGAARCTGMAGPVCGAAQPTGTACSAAARTRSSDRRRPCPQQLLPWQPPSTRAAAGPSPRLAAATLPRPAAGPLPLTEGLPVAAAAAPSPTRTFDVGAGPAPSRMW